MISAVSSYLTLSSPSNPTTNSLSGVGMGWPLRSLSTWSIPWFCGGTAGFYSVKERLTITVSSIWAPETHQESWDFTCVQQLGAAKRASDKTTARCFYCFKGLTKVHFLFIFCYSPQNPSSRNVMPWSKGSGQPGLPLMSSMLRVRGWMSFKSRGTVQSVLI